MYCISTPDLSSVQCEVVTRIVKANIFHHLAQQVVSAGASPASTQRPIIWHRMRGSIRDGCMTGSYGCQSAYRQAAQQTELRQLGHLTFHTVFRSLNHHPEPNCILPGIPSPWSYRSWCPALRYRAGSGSRECFRQQVFFVLLAQQLRQLFRLGRSLMESKPTSGPSSLN